MKKPRENSSFYAEYRNLASLTRNTVEGARKCARVMAFEIAKQSAGGTGKAIRTCAIAGYYRDVRDVSSIILIAEITTASTAPTTDIPGPPYQPFLANYNFFIIAHSLRLSHCLFQLRFSRPILFQQQTSFYSSLFFFDFPSVTRTLINLYISLNPTIC